jgi:primosomal protein N' (replication factor Y)
VVRVTPLPPENPLFAEVAVAVPVDRLFTYRVPEALRAEAVPGRRVRVPFGPRSRAGYLVGTGTVPPPGVDPAKVKEVQAFLDEGPLLDRPLLDLARFISRWYGGSLGEALEAALPAAVKSGGRRRRVPVVFLGKPADATRAAAEGMAGKHAKRARILYALLENDGRMPARELRRVAHCSPAPLKTLAREGWLRIESVEQEADPFALRAPPPPAKPPVPTPEQEAALAAVAEAVHGGRFGVFLLLGVTGSGKTEVYLRALEETVRRGRQAIVLVPEIALTPQTVERFRARCPRVAVLHSALTDAERHSEWRRIRAGEADVVIGPRSAVFAPVPRLGLLVIDEEHETSFKQQNSPRYHARDVGIVRAKEAGAAVVLGSATPSLESYANALDGKYHLLILPRRVGGGALPRVEIVDMLREREDVKRPVFLSRRLDGLLREALERREQGMLFLNRRGYATEVGCRRCGHVMACPGCALPYTFHRRLGLGLCHYCGGEARVPDDCPACGAPGLRRRGFGTEKVEESLRAHYPQARIARMDSDTMKGREAYERVLSAFRAREIDLLLGTQMIAKGLDFPDVTVVGVLNADVALHIPDFRSAERTFQLLAQVAGRAGRAEKVGRVVVQTTMPDHPAVLRAAEHDFEGFAGAELKERKALRWPPWSRVLRVVTLAGRRETAEALALEAKTSVAAAAPGAKVLGPAPTFLEQFRGKHRFHILALAPDPRSLAAAVAAVKPLCRRTRDREVWLDVDPQGTA